MRRGLGRHVIDGALEIVADRQHVAGEIGDGVARRVGLFPLGAAAQILHIGHGAEQPVAHVGVLGEQGVEIGPDLNVRVGAYVLGLGLRGIGDLRLILVGLTRIGLVVGHAKPRR